MELELKHPVSTISQLAGTKIPSVALVQPNKAQLSSQCY